MKIFKILLPSLFVIGVSFKITQEDPWPVPDKYLKMANTMKSDASSVSDGKQLWMQHCTSCHGKTGKGDGPKAAQLKTLPHDLSKADIQSQPDGAFFYKTLEGRKDMPSFKKKLPDQDDIWSIVNYIRTFKK
jgi:mono/diheme cytochrome c family protein